MGVAGADLRQDALTDEDTQLTWPRGRFVQVGSRGVVGTGSLWGERRA